MMTDLENFRATVEHAGPDRVFYYASFTPDLKKRVQEHAGQDYARHYGYFWPQWVGFKRPDDLPKLDFSKYWEGKMETLPEGTTINADGVAMVPSGFYHFWGYVSPLRNAADLSEIENYPLEDFSKWDASGLKKAVDEAHAQGRVTQSFVGHMYETAWQIRGYEQFLMDMIERPAWAQCLLDRIAAQNRIKAVGLAKAGVDWIQTGDDVANQKAMMFQPDMWREMMLSRWAATWKAIKEIHSRAVIWYHCDGNLLAVIGDLVEAGMDILNPLQPECLDVEEVHRRYGKRLTFDGCIGTQSTMPWGKPADVKARVKDLIEKYGRRGGLILSPTHVLEPEVPLANIDAFADACREYGTFPKA
jgi:uroporphyrinogen decarboxylase